MGVLKVLVVSLCLVAFVHLKLVSSKCLYENFSPDYPPVFTQQLGSGEIILRPIGKQINISEGNSLRAYCDSNFSTPVLQSSDPEGTSSVSIKCSKGVLYYVSDDEDKTEVKEDESSKLTCYGSQPEFHLSSYSEQCGNYGKVLYYGFTVNRMNIVLAKYCYSFTMMEPFYIHYRSSDSSSMLQDMRDDNAYLTQSSNAAMNFIGTNEQRTNEINDYFHQLSDFMSNQSLFEFDYLVPVKRLVKSFTHQLDILEGPSSIPWWINLKEGNWKLFEKLLEKEMNLRQFEIYTGVAYNHEIQDYARQQEEEERRRNYVLPQPVQPPSPSPPSVSYNNGARPYERVDPQPDPYRSYPGYYPNRGPRHSRSIAIDSFFNDDIRYLSGSVSKTVPFYIWTYVKSTENKTESTVIFAVNSPFIELKKYHTLEFCRGYCPSWLHDLEASAKMPALGFMFCCKPDEARRYIRGFP